MLLHSKCFLALTYKERAVDIEDIVPHEQTIAKISHHLVFEKEPSQVAAVIQALEDDGQKKQ